VWVVDLGGQTLTVHTSNGATEYGRDEALHGTAPLPDFDPVLRDVLT
jgi:hypothetical protein